MTPMVRRGLHGFFILTYAVIYCGWLVAQPESVVPAPHSAGYFAFLGLMAVPFFAPTLYAQMCRRVGRKRIAFSLFPLVLVLVFAYAIGSFRHSHGQMHPFDPYLQNPPPRFDTVQKEKPADVLRILALGGSTTQCGRLPQADRYPEVLGALLQARYPDRRVEVLNGGKEYYTTQHSLIQFVTYCRDWDPDVVVVLHGINDLCRTFTPGRYAVGAYDPLWSHWYGPAIGAARPPAYELVMCGAFVERALERWYYGWRVKAVDYPLEHYVSLPQFERNLRTLVDYLRQDTPLIVLASQPALYKDALNAAELRQLKFGKHFNRVVYSYFRQEYPSAQSLKLALDEFNRRTRAIAKEMGVLFVDADAATPKTLEYFVDDVHFTRQGAHAVAQAVMDGLLESGWLEATAAPRSVH